MRSRKYERRHGRTYVQHDLHDLADPEEGALLRAVRLRLAASARGGGGGGGASARGPVIGRLGVRVEPTLGGQRACVGCRRASRLRLRLGPTHGQ